MRPPNFQFYALNYLNDCIAYEKAFIRGLDSNSMELGRQETLCRIANQYRIARNFSVSSEASRLNAARIALDEIAHPATLEEAAAAVEKFVEKMAVTYRNRLPSAASKFLWFRYQSPFVIYDSLAAKALSFTGDASITAGYTRFVKLWSERYRRYEGEIDDACRLLATVKPFSLAADMPTNEFDQIVNEKWFSERVFDQFLWRSAVVSSPRID